MSGDHRATEAEAERFAVVGMACRYPGAADVDSFWNNLVNGVDSVTRTDPRPVPGGSGVYTPARGLLADPEWFDAGYFGYLPVQARILSPQHRVFLECGVEALEHAGIDPDRFDGRIGVYAGGTETGYAHAVKAARDTLPPVSDWEILIANGADFLASRLAYKLGLRGPAITVQAACATALVAVHTAVAGLLSGDCDLALAGGAAVHVPAKESPYADGGILSRDGYCRPFDAKAGGTVGADGAGIVVLKRLADALADGDRIHAVLRGTAVNNDGAARVGYTAPSVGGQAAVIRDAQLIAGTNADTIGYVEAHGTGTPLGDPIEIAALTKAFRADTDRVGYCRIGSVKSNIGHTDAAAGAAGLIKAVLAVEHGLIPPSLHYQEPNLRADLTSSPFRVVTSLEEWHPADGTPRRAGVSSFGIGGTNAHVVLEQPPVPVRSSSSSPWQLLPLSARTLEALEEVTARLASYLRANPGIAIADVAWTLQAGRREHLCRRYAIVRDTSDAASVLADPGHPRMADGAETSPRPSIPQSARQLAELGDRWLAGTAIDWAATHAGERRRPVPLPTYPFQRQRYAVESATAPGDTGFEADPTSPADGGDAIVTLTRLIAETLDLPDTGPRDDFFDLGGDSVLATHLLSEVNRLFGVDIDALSLYDAPTAVDLAALIEAERAEVNVSNGRAA